MTIDTIDTVGNLEMATCAANARINLHRLRDFNMLEGEEGAAFVLVDRWLQSMIEIMLPPCIKDHQP